MFEEQFEFEPNSIPILVVDLRVSLFSLLYLVKRNEHLWSFDDLFHFWQARLHLPIPAHPKQRYQLVVVDDFKYVDGTYWRTRFIKKLDGDYPLYKGNRKPEERPEMYYLLHEAAVKYIKENNIPYFSRKGYEADDWAGAICKAQMGNEADKRTTILYTVDSDWGQLVSDEHKIMFYYCNSPVWKHRLRNEEIIKEWFLEKQKIDLENVRQIVEYKHLEGDTADNLAPGSPPGVIDLLYPSLELKKKDFKAINKVLKTPIANSNPKFAIKSMFYMNDKLYDDQLQKDPSILLG